MKKSSKPTQQSNPLNPIGNPGQSGQLGQMVQPGNAGDIQPPSAQQPIKPILTAGKAFTVPARSALRKLSTGEPVSPFDQLLAEVPDRHLRSFLASVFEEPEVRLVLSTPLPPDTRSRGTRLRMADWRAERAKEMGLGTLQKSMQCSSRWDK